MSYDAIKAKCVVKDIKNCLAMIADIIRKPLLEGREKQPLTRKKK